MRLSLNILLIHGPVGDKWHWTIDLLVDDADPVPAVEGEGGVVVVGWVWRE